MDQNTTKRTFSLKKAFLSVFLSFAVLCLLILLGAFLLQNIGRHERFYSWISWIYTVILSFFIALISKNNDGNSVLFSGVVSILFSVFSLAIGCFFANKNFEFVPILIRFAVMIFGSIGATILLNYFGAKKVKTKKWKKTTVTKR